MINNLPQINLKKIKLTAEEQQSSAIQTSLSKTKLKGGSKILKNLGKHCSYNNWQLPSEHRSLDNLFFEKQIVLTINTNMLNSSRCLDFPNGRCMYFNH